MSDDDTTWGEREEATYERFAEIFRPAFEKLPDRIKGIVVGRVLGECVFKTCGPDLDGFAVLAEANSYATNELLDRIDEALDTEDEGADE